MNYIKYILKNKKRDLISLFLFIVSHRLLTGKVSFLYLNLQVEPRITRNITCYLIIAFFYKIKKIKGKIKKYVIIYTNFYLL
ncbi:hypothetical protein SKUN_001524 [Spiroplasma kunkelii CR2-3x]|uniref:Uncharacterized protein n=1 Tax=Spiroplasma kunkelii CR2-3x TaxID=273035 RepID=A0A0K2JIY5_SPIKU|nr:hypothetical protein SKUN_001524 [Spiroplasma kunkelii CR2-3x]